MNKSRKIPQRRQRLYFTLFSLLCISLATYAILVSVKDNIVFFRSPTDIVKGIVKVDERVRIGGLVKTGSLQKYEGAVYNFIITDNDNEVEVVYAGMMPNLFREGQGVVAYGSLKDPKLFEATEILAKHDENYMPKEVYDAVKKSGHLRVAK